VLALDAASYLLFVGCLLAMRPGAPAPLSGTAARGPARTTGLRPAIRFVLGQPTILAITLMFMSFNVGEGILTVLLPTLARDILAIGADGYGLLAAAFTGGLLLGAAVVGAVRWRWPLGRSIAAAQTLGGLVLFGLLPAAGSGLVLATAGVLALAGFVASPLTIWAQTIRMRLIPDELRGRVFALLRTLMQSTPPLGGVIGGTLLAGAAFEAAVVVAALLAVVPGIIALVHGSMAPSAEGAARTAPLADAA
jgi:MFS family permease